MSTSEYIRRAEDLLHQILEEKKTAYSTSFTENNENDFTSDFIDMVYSFDPHLPLYEEMMLRDPEYGFKRVEREKIKYLKRFIKYLKTYGDKE